MWWRRRWALVTAWTRWGCRLAAAWWPSPRAGASFDDSLAVELAGEPAAHAALRALRGLRRARARAAGERRRVDRPVRPVGRRAGGDGRLRRRDPQASGRARPRGERASRSRSARRSGARPSTRTTRARRTGADTGPGRSPLGRPWPDQALAPRGEPPARRRRLSLPARRRRVASLPLRPCAEASRGARASLCPRSGPRGQTPLSMSGVIDSIERAQLRRVPAFQAGDRVRVHFQVVEGTRRRTQVFEGVVIKRQGSGAARDVHRPQAVLRRGSGANVPGALAQDRADRGGGSR